MDNTLIIDNWLLQDVGNCLSNGLSSDDASEIKISQASESHSIHNVPAAGVQLEALLALLVDIVFRDSLVVDSEFTNTWTAYQDTFSTLLEPGFVRAIPFLAHEDKLRDARQFVLGQLCVTPTLREVQQRNEVNWAARGEAEDPYLSTVIWGTAGMLSRSHVFQAHYSGHPLRKRVMEQTILAMPSRDMVAETLEWLRDEKLRLYEVKSNSRRQRTATLVLPPIAIEIIEESSSISQLITNAYQLRDKYAKMREWLRSIQIAMDAEDPKEIAKYKKTLHAVSKGLDRAMGDSDKGKITAKIGLGLPSISIVVGTLAGAMKLFGMRAMLHNQIFTGHGEKSLKKLLRMFGEEKTSVGLAAQAYLQTERS